MKTWADWPAVLLIALGPAVPADDEAEAVTDMEFLEYLGSWDASDDEWLLFERAVDDESGPETAQTDESAETRKKEETDDDT